MLLGVCKLLALLDLWVVNAIPRLTCLCVACMMGAPSATYHGVLASHQYLCRVLRTGRAHACILTGSPTDFGRSGHLLPPRHRRRPAAARAHVRRYATYSMHAHPRSSPFWSSPQAYRLEAATLPIRGCSACAARVRMRVSDTLQQYAAPDACSVRAPCTALSLSMLSPRVGASWRSSPRRRGRCGRPRARTR